MLEKKKSLFDGIQSCVVREEFTYWHKSHGMQNVHRVRHIVVS